MRITTSILMKVWPEAVFHGFTENEGFDLVNIAYLKQFDTMKPKKTLYFVVYEDHPEVEGWYSQPFDRAANLENKRADAGLYFVIDEHTSEPLMAGLKYCRVQNISLAIAALRKYVLEQMPKNFKVIGVTGSVGKTTTAALIQQVLGTSSCNRIYSKRLTPLTLSSWLVNFLRKKDKLVALEYSMYEKHHIGQLTEMLLPHIGVLLNIKATHLGVKGINSLRDIQQGKAALIQSSELGLLNYDDPLAMELRRPGDLTFSLSDSKADAYLHIDGGKPIELVLNFVGERIVVNPYLRTNLFYYQALVAAMVGNYLGQDRVSITAALESFLPEEHRIGRIQIKGYDVIFDGDVMTSSRIGALAENHYASSILMIHSFDFGDETVEPQLADFAVSFAMFSHVRVLDTPENRVVLKRNGWDLVLCDKEEFFSGLEDAEFRVLAFGTYFRRHPDMQYLMDFVESS